MTPVSSATRDNLPAYLPFMDGIRGLAALWVLLYHIQMLSGMAYVPFLSYGELAVDLFMIMSGVLMAHHYLLRREIEPWEAPRSWLLFWIRRFFRIAPLYYVLLLVALVYGPELGEYRAAIGQQWEQGVTDPTRYTNRSWDNILAHVTFIFGIIPAYHFETALPDWSIGLEMQFYAAFPVIMILMARFGMFRAAVFMIAACLLMRWAFNGFWRWEMPSFLPIKLYVFLCGIMIAMGRVRGDLRRPLLFSIGVTVVYFALRPSMESGARIGLVLVMYYLFNDGSLWSFRALDAGLDRVRGMLGGAWGRFLGDASYGVYLVHLLILLPVAGQLAALPAYVAAPEGLRFLLCASVVIPAAYAIAYVLYQLIERPGIALGKLMARRLRA